jgi:hypothetical protein
MRSERILKKGLFCNIHAGFSSYDSGNNGDDEITFRV